MYLILKMSPLKIFFGGWESAKQVGRGENII